MRTRTTLITSITTGAIGVGLALWGGTEGISLVVRGDLLGGAPIEVPSLAPIVAVVAGVVLTIVALLLLFVRDRARELPLAAAAAANAPLLVADAPDDVTFVWADARADRPGRTVTEQRRALSAA